MTAHDHDYHTSFYVQLPITIRAATADDVAKLEWQGEFAHFRGLFQRSYREQVAGNRLMLVATSNDYPIARLFIQFHSKNTLIANGHNRGYLYSFYVMEMFRGHGIGTQLIDRAEHILTDRGFTVATIAVAKDNAKALRLYQRRNYEIFTEDEGKWRYHDHLGKMRHVHEPCWLLAKPLQQG